MYMPRSGVRSHGCNIMNTEYECEYEFEDKSKCEYKRLVNGAVDILKSRSHARLLLSLLASCILLLASCFQYY
jgi:hypothetical protein